MISRKELEPQSKDLFDCNNLSKIWISAHRVSEDVNKPLAQVGGGHCANISLLWPKHTREAAVSRFVCECHYYTSKYVEGNLAARTLAVY